MLDDMLGRLHLRRHDEVLGPRAAKLAVLVIDRADLGPRRLQIGLDLQHHGVGVDRRRRPLVRRRLGEPLLKLDGDLRRAAGIGEELSE